MFSAGRPADLMGQLFLRGGNSTTPIQNPASPSPKVDPPEKPLRICGSSRSNIKSSSIAAIRRSSSARSVGSPAPCELKTMSVTCSPGRAGVLLSARPEPRRFGSGLPQSKREYATSQVTTIVYPARQQPHLLRPDRRQAVFKPSYWLPRDNLCPLSAPGRTVGVAGSRPRKRQASGSSTATFDLSPTEPRGSGTAGSPAPRESPFLCMQSASRSTGCRRRRGDRVPR